MITSLVKTHLVRCLVSCMESGYERYEIKRNLDSYFYVPDGNCDSLAPKVESLLGKYETPKQYFLDRR